MRGQSPLFVKAVARRALRQQKQGSQVCLRCQRRAITIRPAQGIASIGPTVDISAYASEGEDSADARFEVLGPPHALLSVQLSASQKLYTRRGTLVAVAGKPDNAQSTLSLLNPFPRAPFGVPFLYQRILTTSRITALISAKSPTTSLAVLHLDGTTDWIISQRNALLAWTGHPLSLSSRIQTRLSLANWGSTFLTGRGLAALAAPGQVYELKIDEADEFVAHPSNVVGYTVSKTPPQPFRFKSTTLRLQVPSLTSWIPETEFVKTMRKTDTYQYLARMLYGLRTMARRTIWGDRLFLRFKGPATILMSSHGPRVADTLTNMQVNEIADAPAGVLPKAIELAGDPEGQRGGAKDASAPKTVEQAPSAIHVASVRRDGKVTLEDTKGLKDFVP